MIYSSPHSTQFVLVMLFFALAFGQIFKNMLEFQVNRWYENRRTQPTVEYKKPQMRIAYSGLTLFAFLCMGESLKVLGFYTLLAYGVAAIATIPTAIFLWLQMGSMFALMVKGGSAAIDIESNYGMSSEQLKPKN
ncbi:MAG: hypothetical protein EA001_11495 [Oscillatoriales cyanobacterium]|nr:MAG: hypothetical protein EA001_11495 [Oscillatoriales cyanobacterium]